jgi:pyrroloquinoline quinone (PQQ) biosynthesis protein C
MAIATRSVEQFVAEMDEFREQHHVCNTRFMRTFMEKPLPLDRLRVFLKEYYWGMAFDGFFAFAAIAANASPFTERQHYFAIMRNLGSEAGAGSPGGLDHDTLQLLLPTHLGISREEMLDHCPTAATSGYRNTVLANCLRTFETGVAAIPFAVEGMGGRMHRDMWVGFRRHYDFAAEVMAYWTVHDELEGGHGEIGNSMLAAVAQTADQQRRVRDAVTATCLTYEAFWQQFDVLFD